MRLRQVRSGAAQDLVLLFEELDPLAGLAQFG
jgi:hypothetical protein